MKIAVLIICVRIPFKSGAVMAVMIDFINIFCLYLEKQYFCAIALTFSA